MTSRRPSSARGRPAEPAADSQEEIANQLILTAKAHEFEGEGAMQALDFLDGTAKKAEHTIQQLRAETDRLKAQLDQVEEESISQLKLANERVQNAKADVDQTNLSGIQTRIVAVDPEAEANLQTLKIELEGEYRKTATLQQQLASCAELRQSLESASRKSRECTIRLDRTRAQQRQCSEQLQTLVAQQTGLFYELERQRQSSDTASFNEMKANDELMKLQDQLKSLRQQFGRDMESRDVQEIEERLRHQDQMERLWEEQQAKLYEATLDRYSDDEFARQPSTSWTRPQSPSSPMDVYADAAYASDDWDWDYTSGSWTPSTLPLNEVNPSRTGSVGSPFRSPGLLRLQPGLASSSLTRSMSVAGPHVDGSFSTPYSTPVGSLRPSRMASPTGTYDSTPFQTPVGSVRPSRSSSARNPLSAFTSGFLGGRAIFDVT